MISLRKIYITDFYRDENGEIYSIGSYGERVYGNDDGVSNRKNVEKEIFNSQDEFTDFGWRLFQVGLTCITFKSVKNQFLNQLVELQ